MENNEVSILKGSVFIYRVLDAGGEILLGKAEKSLADTASSRSRFTTDKRNAMIMRDAPLKINLGQETFTIAGAAVTAEVSAKVWNYGVISIMFSVPLAEKTPWSELLRLAAWADTATAIDAAARTWKDNLVKRIAPAIINPSDWTTLEDYVTYFIEQFEGASSPQDLLARADVAGLILAERVEELADKTKRMINEDALQYSRHDMAIIDWNSALLIEPDGETDVADIIEFCLTHLLEMRYYDDVLESRLDTLYDSIEEKRGSILTNFYARLSEEASQKYIEFSELIARVDNSIKTVGDFYLATVFRSASRQFRFNDWRASVDRKMATLAQLSELAQGEINSRRSHWLEIIVIILIAVEIVPMFMSVIAK
ncbi:MAG: hypothetical protein WCS77_07750 [Elusimicrobiaceae bacterium]